MSIQLKKYFRVDSVLTDPTSFTLGVIRNDTNAEVVAAGTAMTHDSTGVYSYALTEPASGLTYSVTYVAVYNGKTYTFEETVNGAVEDAVAMPALTGDNLLDTLNSLIVERLRVARAGPKPSYTIAGQRVDWNQYLKYLDERIMALRKEIAMSSPVEEIIIGI